MDHESAPSPGAPTAAGRARDVAVLVLADIAPRWRLWGWSRFVAGRSALRGIPGLRFAKVLGSGRDGGFGLSASASIQGMFCVFDDDACAASFTADDGPLRAWRERARECFSVRLRPYSVRGSWSGMSMTPAETRPEHGPVASLTRASIRPSRAAAFWRMEPPAEVALHDADGCLLSAGIGEAPVLRQATFSIWSDVAAMDAYARTGAHLAAIRASAQGRFFSESMFVRFVPYEARGTWRGRGLA